MPNWSRLVSTFFCGSSNKRTPLPISSSESYTRVLPPPTAVVEKSHDLDAMMTKQLRDGLRHWDSAQQIAGAGADLETRASLVRELNRRADGDDDDESVLAEYGDSKKLR